MMVSASDDIPMPTQDEPNLDKMAQWVQNLFKLKPFYDQMNFNPE